MGFKASIIIVKQPSATITDEALLQKLGFGGTFSRETTFDECMYPNDNSINIGHYNGCLIIADDYQLTDSLSNSKNPESVSEYETALSQLYPDSEILTVACHSVVNYHLYALAKNGIRLRFKMVASEEPLTEYGERLEEEEEVYAHSKIIDGLRMFKSSNDDDDAYDYQEDQMMEDFAFGVAKRHLGVMISASEDEDLMFRTPFRKYKVRKMPNTKKETPATTVTEPGKISWLSRLFGKR